MAKKRREEELGEDNLEVTSESGLEWVMAALVVILVSGFLTMCM